MGYYIVKDFVFKGSQFFPFSKDGLPIVGSTPMNSVAAVHSNNCEVWGTVYYIANDTHGCFAEHCNIANFNTSHILHKNRVRVQIYRRVYLLDNTL